MVDCQKPPRIPSSVAQPRISHGLSNVGRAIVFILVTIIIYVEIGRAWACRHSLIAQTLAKRVGPILLFLQRRSEERVTGSFFRTDGDDQLNWFQWARQGLGQLGALLRCIRTELPSHVVFSFPFGPYGKMLSYCMTSPLPHKNYQKTRSVVWQSASELWGEEILGFPYRVRGGPPQQKLHLI